MNTTDFSSDFERDIDNLAFYETIRPQDAEMVAEQSGLASCQDIELIFPFIKSKKTLLEIGGGYGRVIDGLVARNFKGTIEIIEPSKVFYKFLSDKYKENYKIYYENIQNFKINKKYDVILWMWSQINEFPPDKYFELISNLKKHLNYNGLLIIDTMEENIVPLFTSNKKERYMLVNIESNKIKLFMIKKNEIINLAQKIGFKNIDIIDYETINQRKRNLFILKV